MVLPNNFPTISLDLSRIFLFSRDVYTSIGMKSCFLINFYFSISVPRFHFYLHIPPSYSRPQFKNSQLETLYPSFFSISQYYSKHRLIYLYICHVSMSQIYCPFYKTFMTSIKLLLFSSQFHQLDDPSSKRNNKIIRRTIFKLKFFYGNFSEKNLRLYLEKIV